MAVSSEEEMRNAKQGQGLGAAPGQGLGSDPASDGDKRTLPITDALDTLLQGGNNNEEEGDDPALQDPDHKVNHPLKLVLLLFLLLFLLLLVLLLIMTIRI